MQIHTMPCQLDAVAALAALHAAADAWLDANTPAAWLAAAGDEYEVTALAAVVQWACVALDDATALRYARMWTDRVRARIDTLPVSERVAMSQPPRRSVVRAVLAKLVDFAIDTAIDAEWVCGWSLCLLELNLAVRRGRATRS